MDLSQVLDPDHSVHFWLTSALPLAIAPVLAEVIEVAPVLKKARKATKAKANTTRKRSPKTTTAMTR